MSTSLPRAFGVTHRGLVRPENEDTFLVAPELGLAVVADGVASSGGGAIAARTAVTVVRDVFARRLSRDLLAVAQPDNLAHVSPMLAAAFHEAHRRVLIEATRSGFVNMGTTLSVLLFVAGHAFVAHVGDSRVHRLRPDAIEQITDDHTALNEWIERHGPPTDAVIARLGHVIVRAVSTRMAIVRPDIWVEPTRPGDVFLLSTDGLTKVVEEDAIHDIVLAAPDLETAALALLDAALAEGGPDNITAALMAR